MNKRNSGLKKFFKYTLIHFLIMNESIYTEFGKVKQKSEQQIYDHHAKQYSLNMKATIQP